MAILSPTVKGSSSNGGRFCERKLIAKVRYTFVALALSFAVLALGQPVHASVFAHPEISTSDDQMTVIVNDAPEQDVIVLGKSVVVKKRARGVLAVGGDIIIEGQVEGDVATVGGNIIQREDGYVGGDVIVFGGAYRPDSQTPLREAGKETVIFGMFEDELRGFGQDPSRILSPSFSLGFLAQRLIVALFWFIITLVITTLAPGAVSRAVARVQLSSLKIAAIGAGTLLGVLIVIVSGTVVLPNYLSATLALMGMLIILLAYVFGRVALQVWIGKLVQRNFLSSENRSETLAILLGVLVWTVLLSLPYLWLLALFTIFAFGIGLVLTGRTSPKWKNP